MRDFSGFANTFFKNNTYNPNCEKNLNIFAKKIKISTTKLMLKNESITILKKYFPENAIPSVLEMVKKNDFQIVFTNPRKTKKGTFVFAEGKPLKITLNGDLQPEEMLLVFLHEMAHLFAFKQYGRKIKPHGYEWQTIFLSLIEQSIDNKGFSKKMAKVLTNCFFSPKPHYRPNCPELYRYFYPPRDGKLYLYQLSENDKFVIAKNPNKQFILLKKRRTQYLCKNLVNDRLYLVHYFIEIKKLYE